MDCSFAGFTQTELIDIHLTNVFLASFHWSKWFINIAVYFHIQPFWYLPSCSCGRMKKHTFWFMVLIRSYVRHMCVSNLNHHLTSYRSDVLFDWDLLPRLWTWWYHHPRLRLLRAHAYGSLCRGGLWFYRLPRWCDKTSWSSLLGQAGMWNTYTWCRIQWSHYLYGWSNSIFWRRVPLPAR